MQGFLRLDGYLAKANRPGIVIALLGLTFLGISISAPRSSAHVQQTITKPLEHEVGVVLKLIHVYVTDKKGKPVRDLAKEDFELFDNGTPVTITEFEKHLSAELTQDAGPERPDETITISAPPQPALVPQFILFFDFAFNNLPGINKAKQAALHFVNAETEPSDEISVFSYSPLKGLTVHEYSTRDRQKVLDTIQALDPAEIVGRAEDVEEEYQRSLAGSEMRGIGESELWPNGHSNGHGYFCAQRLQSPGQEFHHQDDRSGQSPAIHSWEKEHPPLLDGHTELYLVWSGRKPR